MSGYQITLVAFFVFEALGCVFMIGKKRQAITPGEACAVLLLNAALIYCAVKA